MPEGHTIHRAARLQRRRFAGEVLEVDSPQGRFADGAAELSGRRLEGVDALGKHLFHRWEGDLTVHIHLGLFGKFRVFSDVSSAPEPTDGTRMRWRGDAGVMHLSGPTACEIIDGDQEDLLRQRIGPDPLAVRDGDIDRVVASLARRSAPIAQVLLDQAVVAGIGNVYRAEFCFLAGIDPRRPAKHVDDDSARHLWELSVSLMKIGERIGRIVTVDPAEVGAKKPGDLLRGSRLYVYKRAGQPCRRCATPITSTLLASRRVWWCPTCQPS
jgi:endonuclease-8